MLTCACSGIRPTEFLRMPIWEIAAVAEAEGMARKNGIIDRVNACVRALGQAFGGKNAFDGLLEERPSPAPISIAEARRLRFWRSDDA